MVGSVPRWRTFWSESTTPMAIFVPPRSAPIAALTSACAGRSSRRACGIDSSMPDAGDKPEQPERTDPPEYTVYKSRPRLSRPDPQARPLRPRRPAQARRRRRRQAAEAVPRSPDERPLVAQGAEVGRDRRPRLDRAQLPRLRGLGPDPEVRSSPTASATCSTATRSCSSARRRSSCSAPTCARAPSPGADEAESKNCIDAVTSGRPTDDNCKNGPYRSDTIMLIRAGGGTFRKLSIPRDTLAEVPGPGPAEDQLRLRLRRRQARRAHGRGPARDRRRPGRDHRLRRLSQLHRHDRRDRRRPADRRLLERLRAAPSTSTSSRARTTSTASRRSPWRARARTAAATGEFAGTDVERAQFQQLILDGIKGKLTSITSAADELHQGPADRLERAQGDGLEHGRADDAPAGALRRDRRRRHRRAHALGHDRPPATWSSRPRSASAPPRSCSARSRRAARTARSPRRSVRGAGARRAARARARRRLRAASNPTSPTPSRSPSTPTSSPSRSDDAPFFA